MISKTWMYYLIAIFAFVLCLVIGGHAKADTHQLLLSNTTAQNQNELYNCSNGDSVWLQSGTYTLTNSLIFGANVSINGTGNATTSVNYVDHTAFFINSSASITMMNFQIYTYASGDSIVVGVNANLNISSMVIRTGGWDILFNGSAILNITNSSFQGGEIRAATGTITGNITGCAGYSFYSIGFYFNNFIGNVRYCDIATFMAYSFIGNMDHVSLGPSDYALSIVISFTGDISNCEILGSAHMATSVNANFISCNIEKLKD